MRSEDHGDIVAQREDVEARVLQGSQRAAEALALLDRTEAEVDVPLVDESERARLQALVAGEIGRDRHWHSLLAQRNGEAAGYAGVLLDSTPRSTATGDIAVDRVGGRCGPVLASLLAGASALAASHRAARLEVWLRHATPEDVGCAEAEDYELARRLGVLGLDLVGLASLPQAEPPPGVVVRAYRPEADDEAIVAVLRSAYAGTSDAGWDEATFAQRRSYDWFRPDDLLVAQAGDGEILGLHWTKRRSERVGEVYNLAIAPQAQGRRLGGVLLDAGLVHLQEAGCREVLLWVDVANERAVKLYASRGFVTRWEDVALAHSFP